MTEDKRGPGRPAHEPTEKERKMVESMSAYGIPQQDIAAVLGINRSTLLNHYREELDTARSKANAKVAEMLYRQATDIDNPRSVTAAIFWLKTRAGWKETMTVENVGRDGGPIETKSMNDKELARQVAFLLAKATQGE